MFLFCYFYLNYFLIPRACLPRKLTKIRHFEILNSVPGGCFFSDLCLICRYSLFYSCFLKTLDKNSLSDIYNQDDVAKSERGAKPKSKHSNTSACVSFAKMVALMAVCYSVCWITVLVSFEYILIISMY